MKKIICLLFVSMWCWYGSSHADAENPILQWERIRIKPSIILKQTYSDNIFRQETDEKQENVTKISPAVTADWAWTEHIVASTFYRYGHSLYSEYDNFREDQHEADLSVKWHTAKGSHVQAGGRFKDTAVQPFSENDDSKDFYKLKGYLDLNLPVSAIWELHSKYYHQARNFSETQNQDDDFERDFVRLGLIYKRFRRIPLLLGYNVLKHDADDASTGSIDMVLHRYHLGARWKASERIIGDIKIGYLFADFDGADSIDGFSSETDVRYSFSDITTFQIVLNRTVIPSTRAERDSNAYYEYSHGAFRINYDYFDPLRIKLGYAYHQKDFQSSSSELEARVDRISHLEAAIAYGIKKTVEIMIGYQYENYDSNRDALDYKDNRFNVSVAFRL